MNETITVEEICKIEKGPFNLNFVLLKRLNGIQLYSVSFMFSETEPQYGFIIDDIHIRLPANDIGFIVPFDNDSCCWECGGLIMTELFTSFDDVDIEKDFQCWCYNPQFVKTNKNMKFPYVPEFEVQTEMLGPGPRELIKGASYDSIALIEYAKNKGWDL